MLDTFRKYDPQWHYHKDGTGRFLIEWGGDPNEIKDRIAFIEKSPRIRIASAYNLAEDAKNWAYGDKGRGLHDEESAAWCIKALEVFGWAPMDPAMVELDRKLTEMTQKRNNLLKVIEGQISKVKGGLGITSLADQIQKAILELEEVLAKNS